jgi:hypothetical protein
MRTEQTEIAWTWDGENVRVGVERTGAEPTVPLLPALSSIPTRGEMRPLQERLAPCFATVAVDWPGARGRRWTGGRRRARPGRDPARLDGPAVPGRADLTRPSPERDREGTGRVRDDQVRGEPAGTLAVQRIPGHCCRCRRAISEYMREIIL